MPDSLSADQLLAHARWVEGFARALVREDAEDVAQDAWIAAIQHPQAAPSKGWFATVMRNVTRMRFRSASRRRAREEAIEEPTVATPAELAHRMEMQRRLTSAVLALDEPQRTAVVLVFYEGLSPAEVARKSGIPATTVRSRLRAALEVLRERLDAEEGGDRARWKLALAPLATVKAATAPLLAIGLAAVAAMTATAIVVVAATRPPAQHPASASPVTSHAAAPVPPSSTPAPILTVDAADEPEAPRPNPTISPAFLRAEKTLVDHIDECYTLSKQAGREVHGVVQLTVSLETHPRVDLGIQFDMAKTTIADPDFLECVSENGSAMADHLEQLRASGEVIEGPITMNITRPVPPPPKQRDEWPADTDSPPCPIGTKLAGANRVKQWCEEPNGVKHGPEWIWDKQGHLVLKTSHDHGTPSNSIEMHEPESD